MSAEKNSEINELILSARNGCEDSLNGLIANYEPLMNSLLSRFSSIALTKEDLEDLKQEILIIFCNAVMKYDLDQKEVDFGLYAKICIEHALVSQLRAAKRRIKIEPIPVGDGLDLSDADDPSLKIIEAERIREMWKLINENLSEYENKVWNLHLSGLGSSDIAKEMNRDIKSIDNALFRIRAKLRKALKGTVDQ
ncbi:MAG: sigma-70 family RNA polymerase sigma factor [Ruminococcaceae bacterium]|nr:sigma-70 family RNA polymerase sigma factor [Oscillospiraceae bacterium]